MITTDMETMLPQTRCYRADSCDVRHEVTILSST